MMVSTVRHRFSRASGRGGSIGHDGSFYWCYLPERPFVRGFEEFEKLDGIFELVIFSNDRESLP